MEETMNYTNQYVNDMESRISYLNERIKELEEMLAYYQSLYEYKYIVV